MYDLPPAPPEITVTASLSEEDAERTPASVTIVDRRKIQALAPPLVQDLLRLTPSAAVSTSGPMGALTDVRIRGAEANHSLLFIDGIRANDPAAGNIPRFELLNADLAGRIEVVRGPQSALWGSEAIGGVIAIEGDDRGGARGLVEAGSHGFARASAGGGARLGALALAFGAGWQGAQGIDAFGGSVGGDRDGYANRALRARAGLALGEWGKLALSGFAIRARSDFDGYAPPSYDRADTLDYSRSRLAAARAGFEGRAGAWQFEAAASRLWSANRNLNDGDLLNRTRARRDTLSAQAGTQLRSGAVEHRVTLALEEERERFAQRDLLFADANQDQRRGRTSGTIEWRASSGARWTADLALRRDRFDRFKDATTVRAGLRVAVARQWTLAGSYGEGIAQPTFFDLFGFYPDYFVGNPALEPERSRGFEVSARFSSERVRFALTGYRQRLTDEIVTLFFPVNTAVNRNEHSRRQGLELDGEWRPSPALRLSGQLALLDAQEADAGGGLAREARRPKLGGSVALDGTRGKWRYGLSLAHSGAQRDRQDSAPYRLVTLDPYWLAGARLGYAIDRRVELFARLANAFDDRQQDVAGYRTEGRTAYAGIRIAAGD